MCDRTEDAGKYQQRRTKHVAPGASNHSGTSLPDQASGRRIQTTPGANPNAFCLDRILFFFKNTSTNRQQEQWTEPRVLSEKPHVFSVQQYNIFSVLSHILKRMSGVRDVNINGLGHASLKILDPTLYPPLSRRSVFLAETRHRQRHQIDMAALWKGKLRLPSRPSRP